MIFILIIGLALAVFSGRVYTSAGAHPSVPQLIVGLLSAIAFLALIAWGFLSVRWYWLLLGLLVGGFSSVLINRQTIVWLWRLSALFDFIVVGAAIYLWLAFWPF